MHHVILAVTSTGILNPSVITVSRSTSSWGGPGEGGQKCALVLCPKGGEWAIEVQDPKHLSKIALIVCYYWQRLPSPLSHPVSLHAGGVRVTLLVCIK
jgi:hypothetical protein